MKCYLTEKLAEWLKFKETETVQFFKLFQFLKAPAVIKY